MHQWICGQSRQLELRYVGWSEGEASIYRTDEREEEEQNHRSCDTEREKGQFLRALRRDLDVRKDIVKEILRLAHRRNFARDSNRARAVATYQAPCLLGRLLCGRRSLVLCLGDPSKGHGRLGWAVNTSSSSNHKVAARLPLNIPMSMESSRVLAPRLWWSPPTLSAYLLEVSRHWHPCAPRQDRLLT